MNEERYNQIKEFMNGRDVSQSYSDPGHKSTIDFQEFVYVWEQEQLKKQAEEQPIEEPPVE